MKRIIFTVAAVVAVVGSSFAQKATLDNPWSLEGGINYSGANGIDWKAPSIRARYFVNENIAARVQLGLGDGTGTTARSEKYTYNAVTPGPDAGQVGTLEINRMKWNAQVGAEYHLAGTDRLSPYFMLVAQFGGGSSTTTWTDAVQSGPNSTDGVYFKNESHTVKGKTAMFGVGLGAGLDVYIIENLYLGLELGLSFRSVNSKDVEISGTTNDPLNPGTILTYENTLPGNKKSYLETGGMNAAFRLGWRF